MASDKKFPGFDIPRQNWFRLPNDWTNLTAEMRSWAEQKVIEYVLRHTWGFQEYGMLKRITLDEFENGRKRRDGSRMDQGIGMRRQAIISGIRQAVEDGFLVEEVDNRDKARIKKYYGLRMLSHPEQGYEDHTPEVRSSHTGGVAITLRTEKETLERNQKKDTSNRDSTDQDLAENIIRIITDFSREVLNDESHTRSNISQAHNIWREAGLTEDEFIDALYAAKAVTLERTGGIKKLADDRTGLKNRAPYFFRVLRNLVLEQE